MITRIVDLCFCVLFVLVVIAALSTCAGPDELDAARITAQIVNDRAAEAAAMETNK